MRPFEPLTYEELPPRLKTLLPEGAAVPLKLAAANANLPLLTQDLVTCLYFLSNDEERQVRATARKSLTELPLNLLLPAISGINSPKILHWFANRKFDDPAIYERILLNRATEDETFLLLAKSLDRPSLLDLITQNQQRFVRLPEILEALQQNQNATLSNVQRAIEFFFRQTGRHYTEVLAERRKAGEPERPEAEAVERPSEIPPGKVPRGEPLGEVPAARAEVLLEEEMPQDFSIEELEKETFLPDELFADDLLVDPQIEFESELRESLANKINKMTVLNKMRLALKGNIEARGILIKSANRMIQECVLRNPRVTIEEIIKLSKDKAAREELIRLVAANKDWTKNYQVLSALCWNPKTPMDRAAKYLQKLNIRDLVSISRSKQVPGMIAIQARKLAQEKEKVR